MSEITFTQQTNDLFTIDLINGEWYSVHDVTKEDINKMKKLFDYDYLENKYGWV